MLRSAASRFLRQSPQARIFGTQLRFAETQVAGKSVDWDELQDFVTSDDGKRELSALQTSFNQLQSQSGPSKTVTINWDQYKGDVEPETLAIFQKAYLGLKFPNYDPSKDIEDTRAAFKPLYEQAEELAAFSEKRIKEINAELKALETEKERMSQLTIDEELANHPELAKEIDKEISESNFSP